MSVPQFMRKQWTAEEVFQLRKLARKNTPAQKARSLHRCGLCQSLSRRAFAETCAGKGSACLSQSLNAPSGAGLVSVVRLAAFSARRRRGVSIQRKAIGVANPSPVFGRYRLCSEG